MIDKKDLPKPFQPRPGEQYFYMDSSSSEEFGSAKYSYPYNYDVGLAWRTEKEVRIVIKYVQSLFE